MSVQIQNALSQMSAARNDGVNVNAVATTNISQSLSGQTGYVLAGTNLERKTASFSTVTTSATMDFQMRGDAGLHSVYYKVSPTGATSTGLTVYWSIVDSTGGTRTRAQRALYVDGRANPEADPSWAAITPATWPGTGATWYELLLYDPAQSADVLPVPADDWNLRLSFTYAGPDNSLLAEVEVVAKRGV